LKRRRIHKRQTSKKRRNYRKVLINLERMLTRKIMFKKLKILRKMPKKTQRISKLKKNLMMLKSKSKKMKKTLNKKRK